MITGRRERFVDLLATWINEGAVATVATSTDWADTSGPLVEDLAGITLPDGRFAAVGYFAHNVYSDEGVPTDAAGPAMWIICVVDSLSHAAARLEEVPDPYFPEKVIDLETGTEVPIVVRLTVTPEAAE